MLNILYITGRPDPKLEWFLGSLGRECAHDWSGVNIIMVSSAPGWSPHNNHHGNSSLPIVIVKPKQTVWQGPHRLSREDYWAKCNALNTGLCLAHEGWVSVMDDLSVLTPGWLSRVREAMTKPDTITLGAYKKVKRLVVEKGEIKSFEPYPPGVDSRWSYGNDSGPVRVGGSWMYGHVTAPLDAFLKINGYPEHLCDSMGFEDVLTGIRLEKAGYKFAYDRRILVLESEELHHLTEIANPDGSVTKMTTVKRSDFGVSPNDKSHAALNRVLSGDFSIWNSYNLTELRAAIQAGHPFPPPKGPTHEWFTGRPISEM